MEPNFLLLLIMVANIAIISSSKDKAPDLSINSVHAQNWIFENVHKCKMLG